MVEAISFLLCLRASACASQGTFLEYTTYHSTDKCEFSGVSIPCAWVCVLVDWLRLKNIYSSCYICKACPSDDTSNDSASWTVARRLCYIRDDDTYMVCLLCVS